MQGMIIFSITHNRSPAIMEIILVHMKVSSMNTLIIYDSKFGNTGKIVQAMTFALKNYGIVHAASVDEADIYTLINAHEVDLLIIGCPTQKHKVSPGMMKLLDTIPPQALKGLPTATFDTRYTTPRWFSGSAAQKLSSLLDEKGSYIMAEPQSFFVTDAEGPLRVGELDRAASWSQSLVGQLATPA
jgi:flavodoxin